MDNTTYNEDILRPIYDSEFDQLLKMYNKPQSIIEYNFLIQHVKRKEFYNNDHTDILTPRFLNNFYTHRSGDFLKNGTFVAIIIEDKNHTIYIATLESDFKELQECVSQTERIHWNKRPIFGCLYERYQSFVLELIKSKGLTIAFHVPCDGWALPSKETIDFDFKIPADCQIRPLQIQDAIIVNEYWPHRSDGSINYVTCLIAINGGLGIFNSNDELVSWILLNEYNGLGMLQTIDREKRKGLALTVTKAFCKYLLKANHEKIRSAEEDMDRIFCFIVLNNKASINIFKQLKFTVFNRIFWLGLN